MDKATLRARLEKSVESLDEMINATMMEAMANDVDPYSLRHPNGAPALAPLVITQTSALLMLASLPEGD